MKNLFKFKYPKIFLLSLSIVSAYYIFKNPSVSNFVMGLGSLGYLGTFIAGMLFAFGFSAPFAVGFFITLNPSNIWVAGVIGGIGALVSDISIFRLIRFSFIDEFNRIKNSKAARRLNKFIGESFGGAIRRYFMYIFAGILIASPLPDEVGVIMLSGLTKVKEYWIGIIGFVLNTIGILIILSI